MARSIITEICEAQGREYQWLAKQLGVSKFTFSRIEAGTQPPPPGYYERAAQVLGVPIRFLLPPEPDREPEPEPTAA